MSGVAAEGGDSVGSPFQQKELSRKSVTTKFRQSPYSRRTPRIREIPLDDGKTDSRLAARRRSLRSQASALMFKSWKTFKVTPLFEFSYEKQKFKEYSSRLSSYIEREKKKNIGVLVDHEANYKITISTLQDVNVSQADDKAVTITIAPKSIGGGEKPLFSCILVSVERRKDTWEHRLKEKYFTVLPLLLVSGRQFFVRAVVKFLEGEFSCIVQPLAFSSFQLMWMLAMWAGCKPEVGPKPLFMEYKLPLQNLHTIQYSIAASSVYEIWSQIHDPKSNEMDIDEVNAFIAALEKHFRTLFAVDLAHLQLSSIGTAAAAIHKNGIAKLLNVAAVPFVLRHLTSLAQECSVT